MNTQRKITESQAALQRAITLAGSATALAGLLGITKGAVSQWKDEGRKVPAEYCPSIERITDSAVRCEDLRPDVDWAFIRASGHSTPRDGQRRTSERRAAERRVGNDKDPV